MGLGLGVALGLGLALGLGSGLALGVGLEGEVGDEMFFIDEGSVDPFEAVKALHGAGFTGFLITDHVPKTEGDTRWGHRSRAYALGYTFVNPEEFPGFSNAYYRALVELGCEWGGECAWEETTDAAGRAAYLSGGAASTRGRYLMYLADLVLATDPGFRTYVQLYADRNDVWKRDLKHALEILLELGCVGLYPVPLQ